MSLIDSTNEAPAEPPAADDVFPDEGSKKTAVGGELPDAGEVFPDQPNQKRVTGTVAPGPLGDWLFGNTQQSSLARIMHAFGSGVDEAADHGKKLLMSDETAEYLRKHGIFNDYVNGQSSVLKAYNETFLRSGAVVVNTAIHGVPAVVHGLQEAAVEIGQQTGQPKLGREIAALPEAFPTGMRQPTGIVHMTPGSRPVPAPVPEPLAAARDLNVIGPGGEAAWKGVAREEAEAPASVVPQEALPAEAPKDVHAAARAVDPATMNEFDALEKRRDEFKRWKEEGGEVPPAVDEGLKETEARLRELEPQVTAAYDKAKEGLPAEARPVEAPTEAAVPQGVPETARPIEDQRDYIVQDAKRQLKAAGRPEDEAAAVAQLIAARYEARASRMNGALGTAEELYDREAAEIRGQQIRAKVKSPAGRAALEGFQERMAQGKDTAKKLRDEGGSSPFPVYEKAGDKYANMSKEDLKAMQDAYEDSIEGLEPEERAGAREEFTQDDARELYQIDAYHGSPHLFEKFDTSKIGTGEGAQAYGHGLYFAENQAVAQGYHEGLGDKPKGLTAKLDDKEDWHTAAPADRTGMNELWGRISPYNIKTDADAARVLARAKTELEKTIHNVDTGAIKVHPHDAEGYREALRLLNEDRVKFEPPRGHGGALYKVSLKPNKEDLLDWDKPLSEQSEKVRAAVQSLLKNKEVARRIEALGDNPTMQAVYGAIGRGITHSGWRGYGAVGEKADAAASAALSKAGIPGIKYADAGSRTKEGGTHNFVIFDHNDVEITHRNGEALTKEERQNAVRELEQRGDLNQTALGKINLNPKGLPGKDYTGAEGVRPVLTLMKNANASTAVHELGHEWLAQMLRDAEREKAPEGLKADRDTLLKWFGVEKTEDIATKHHEKFARGFEQYLREGVAPSQQLARVFAKFKEYLTRIYQTLKGLGQPINDDIRRVFDRMLEQNPERVMVAAEREAKPEFHERHAEAAETIAEEHSREVAGEVQAERDSHAERNLVDQEDAASRLTDTEPRVGVRAPGAAQSAGHADEAGNAGSPGASAEARSVVPGGGEAAAEGAGVLPAARGEIENPNTRFSDPSTDLIDKAGNIRLDKLNQAEDVTEVIRQAARNNNAFLQERRGVLSDGTTLDLADALGMDPAWLDRKKIGEAYNVEEIRAARRLLVQSAQNVRELMIAAKKGGEQEALQKLAEGIARHEMIQGKVSGATAEAGRALRAFREILPGQTDQLNLDYFLKTHTGRTLFQLQQMAEFGSRLESPSQISRFVHDTANGKVKQAVLYYYVNSLISGPVTHTRYLMGNALTAIWAPIKTVAAAGIDTGATIAGLQNERRIFLGEAGAEILAFTKGSREGIKAFKEGMATGNTPHLPGEAHPDMFGTAPLVSPIPGTLGKVIGFPGKTVAGIHGFSSAVRYEQEIAKLAYRQASREGLSGQNFINRVGDLGNRPTPEMTEAAARVARRDLYMAPADYSSMEAAIGRVANQNIITKLILPFTKIGTQIASQAIENSLAGIFMSKVRENLSGKNGIEARNTQAASIFASTALMGTIVGMASEGMVTGAGPSDPQQQRVWRLTHNPYSVTVGGVSIPYKGLGMLGMQMSMAANAYEAYHGFPEPGNEHEQNLVASWIEAFEKSVLDDTWLRGLKDMLDAVFHHEEYGDRFVANMVTNWVPYSIGLSQVNRAFVDPYQRETRGNTLLESIEKEVQAKVPFWSQDLMPRRDQFGEPIPSSGTVQNYANDPVAKLMDQLHFKVSPVPRKIRGVALTDQQFDDFSRLSGRMGKSLLDQAVATPGFANLLPAAQVERMHKIISLARSEAEKTVMMNAFHGENDIVTQAAEAKKIKKGLVPEPVH